MIQNKRTMKKFILALALMVTLVACSGPATEVTVPAVDSTVVVAVDSAACCVDSTVVDTCVAK